MKRFGLPRKKQGLVLSAAIIAALFICVNPPLPAQQKLSDLEHTPSKRGSTAMSAKYIGPQPFDILHYVLDLSFAMTTEDMGGRIGMTMVLKAPTDSLVLNEVALALDTVQVDGVRKNYTVEPAHESFTIQLAGTRNAGDTLHITIDYRRVPGVARPSGRLGYYYFTPQSVAGTLPDTIGYTMSEPSDARFWMPCFDDPSEKSSLEVNATVPPGFVPASNGKLLGTSQNANGTVTWHWREDHQITPYLMCVTVSKWAVYTYPFVRAANDTVPVQYYVFKPDNVAFYLPTVADMISVFSSRYGDYPWDKYGMTGVIPFSFGGMEHQSITTLHRSIETSGSVVSHELAHQWWGDLVTCGTWKDIWLNESFATYSEAIWNESEGGPSALRSTMQNMLALYDGSWQSAVYDPEGQGQYIFSDLVYGKGAWVLHTLRGVLGDSLFFRTLRAYRQKFSQGNAVTDDLRAVADSVTGTSMAWFFDEWLYKPGWPVYAFGYSWASNTLSLRINQQQTSPRPIYTMPIQVRVYHGGTDSTFVVQDNVMKQVFNVPLSYRPDSVKFDPDSWILKQVAPPLAGVDDETGPPTSFSLEQNWPNPFNPSTTIHYTVGGTGGRGPTLSGVEGSEVSKTSLRVYDVLGRQVATLVNEEKAPGAYQVEFDGSGLSSGVYYYRLTAGSFTQTRAMMLIK